MADKPAATTYENDPLDLENWYPTLKKYTFKTTWIDLDRDTARAIYDSYQIVKGMGYQKALETLDKNKLKLLTKAAEDVQKAIDSLGDTTAGVFCRLSTRSPKDYALRAAKTTQILKQELANVKDDDEVGQVIAIIRYLRFLPIFNPLD